MCILRFLSLRISKRTGLNRTNLSQNGNNPDKVFNLHPTVMTTFVFCTRIPYTYGLQQSIQPHAKTTEVFIDPEKMSGSESYHMDSNPNRSGRPTVP